MDLYLIRHAAAHDRDPARWPSDRDRPLTAGGTEDFVRAAKGLAQIATTPELVLTSPLIRTVQTAEVLSRVIGWPQAQPSQAIEPGMSPDDLAGLLSSVASTAERVAIVGHEPDLGVAISVLSEGAAATGGIAVKKGGAARLVSDGLPSPGTATLRWLVTPGILRKLN